jgi:hypothetical protein
MNFPLSLRNRLRGENIALAVIAEAETSDIASALLKGSVYPNLWRSFLSKRVVGRSAFFFRLSHLARWRALLSSLYCGGDAKQRPLHKEAPGSTGLRRV